MINIHNKIQALYFNRVIQKQNKNFILPESLVFGVFAVARRDEVPVAEGGLGIAERLPPLPSFRPRFKSFLLSDGGRVSSNKILNKKKTNVH